MENIRETGDSSAVTDSPITKSGLTTESPVPPNRNSSAEIAKRSLAAATRRKGELDRFLAAPREDQRKIVEDKWAQLCYELVGRASLYAKTATDKDFGKLAQLVTSAAISKDKVFHREDAQQKSGNVVFNLFGNVGLDAIKRMLQPPTPVVKVVNPKESKEIGNEINPIGNDTRPSERL